MPALAADVTDALNEHKGAAAATRETTVGAGGVPSPWSAGTRPPALPSHDGPFRPLRDYAALALPRVALWHTALGLGVMVLSFLVLSVAYALLIVQLDNSGKWEEQLSVNPLSGAPGPALIFLASFLLIHLSLLVSLRLVHGRGWASLLGAPPRRRWRQFWIGATLALALALVPGLLGTLIDGILALLSTDAEDSAGGLRQIRALGEWLPWALLALPFILVQSAAEELIFRGYLLQQLAARFRSPVAWAVIPSLLFGLLHYNPAALGALTWLHVLVAFVGGLILALVTARLGSPLAAIGLHFAHNAIGLLFIGIEGFQDAFALFVEEIPLTEHGLAPGPFIASAIIQIIVELAAFAFWWRWMNRRETRRGAG